MLSGIKELCTINKDIDEYREKFTRYVNELTKRSRSMYREQTETIVKMRGISRDTFEEQGIFYIRDSSEMLLPEYFDDIREFGIIAINNRPIYNDRWVIPIYDMQGRVKNLVGYRAGNSDKYMYAGAKYFVRGDAIYGEENIKECIKSGYMIVVEGLMDRLRCIDLGYKNVIATCGADKSLYRMRVFNRVPRVLFIPDNDSAGRKTREHWKCKTYLRLELPSKVKDIDEMAHMGKEYEEFTKGLLKESINELLNYTDGTVNKIDMRMEMIV